MKVFCSYHFVINDHQSGFGNAMFQTEKEFPLPLSEIRRFEREIKEKCNFKNVVLLNFIMLGGVEE